ncbi:trypsin-like serine protease [Streptomyces sp. NPDC050856]|uniref:trypsin-like serine peptidase n=1 Tax=Streptomyces sp. NPDC050856 TaxID=3154939 RepID=UPI0033E8FF63
MHWKRPLLWTVALLTAATACTVPSHSAPRPAAHGGQERAQGQERRPAPAPVPSSQRSAAPSAGLPSVGVLLDDEGHWCTASVVASPRGNVVATAAHCVYEYGVYAEGFSFVPGFRGKGAASAPYGKWRVRAIQVDDAWRRTGDDARDYAFLTLEPDGRGRQVQQVVGGAPADWGSGPRRHVTVVGYPNEEHNPANRPISCTTDTAEDPDLAGSMVMRCAGFWDGTSGSPWLADHRDAAHPGRVIGVLSGGDTDTTSTAVLFDARARALYTRAVKA